MTAELRARVLALLRGVQHHGFMDPCGNRCCPRCAAYKPKHAPDCELAALIAELERENEAERQPQLRGCTVCGGITTEVFDPYCCRACQDQAEAERQAGMEQRAWDTLAGGGEDEQ